LVVNLSGQLVSGEKKTMYIDDNGFIILCVKDDDIASASQISSGCNEANETDFSSCLGNSTGITINNINCYDEGAIIRIENLSYSGIKGTQASPPIGGGDGGGGGGGGWGAIIGSNKTPPASEKALFDIVSTIITPQITLGENLTARISLLNFGNKTNLNVTLNYLITDSNNNTILSEKEIVPVEIQAEFIKEFMLPSQITLGEYKLFVEINYEGQEKEAVSQGSFEILPEKQGFYWIIGISLLAIIIVIIVVYVLVKSEYINKIRENKKLREEARIKEKIRTMFNKPEDNEILNKEEDNEMFNKEEDNEILNKPEDNEMFNKGEESDNLY
jgi:hypothetical protein